MKLPKNWKILDEKVCKQLMCKFAYTKTSNDQQTIINVYELKEDYDKVVDKTIASLEQVRKENKAVDGNPNDKDFENTALIFPIYFSEITIDKNKAFLSVSNYLVNDDKYITYCQIYYKTNDKTQFIQFPIIDISETEKDIYDILKQDETFNEVLQYIKEN